MKAQQYIDRLLNEGAETQKMSIVDIFDGYPEEGTVIYDYGSRLFNIPMTVINVDPQTLKSYDLESLLDQFNAHARPWQKKLVGQYIKKYPYDRPIIIHGRMVVDGNHRTVAAIKAGLKSIPAVDLSEII